MSVDEKAPPVPEDGGELCEIHATQALAMASKLAHCG
jgi:hypothetical protein